MLRWAKVGEFLPSSPSQVLGYLRFRKYKVPLHRKTHQPTCNEETLRALARKHHDRVLGGVLLARALLKAKGYLDATFVGRDGRFHPIYNFHPATGRLAARAPNVMNQPRGRSDAKAKLAKAVRSTIVPTPGFLLVEADWKAIEAVLVGYFADDPTYIRFARLGVHAILAARIAGKRLELDAPDAVLRKACLAVKEAHPYVYERAKKTVHARSYGEGVAAIARDLGCTWEEAGGYVAAYEEMAPLIPRWQAATQWRAYQEKRLTNPFGFVSPYFGDVFKRCYEGTPEYERALRKPSPKFGKASDGRIYILDQSSQANEALAFLPQSTGAAMLRRTLVRLDEACDLSWLRPLVPIHDSILFEVRKDMVEQGISLIRHKMEAKWEELGGLHVEVEVKVGESWAKMRSPSSST